MAKKTTQKLYAAVSPDFGPRFAFNAKSQEKAQAMITGWNRYHSFYDASTAHTVEEIKEADLPNLRIAVHNEYF